MAGGQPFSLGNLRAVRALCQHHGIRVMLDATRAMENAWFIKKREPGHSHRSCAEILREICDLTDGCTMSGKKDLLVNIGGFLALRDVKLYEKASNWSSCSRVCTRMAAWPDATWKRWPAGLKRQCPTITSAPGLVRFFIWARSCLLWAFP